jgi:hypothetical protein
LALEEAIKDEGGCWIFFNRLMAKVEEDDKNKKKAPPAKGGAGDEPKSVYGRAWVDLSQFKDPGTVEHEV